MFPSSLLKSKRVGVVSVVNKYIIWFKRKNSFFGKHFCCLSDGGVRGGCSKYPPEDPGSATDAAT